MVEYVLKSTGEAAPKTHENNFDVVEFIMYIPFMAEYKQAEQL